MSKKIDQFEIRLVQLASGKFRLTLGRTFYVIQRPVTAEFSAIDHFSMFGNTIFEDYDAEILIEIIIFAFKTMKDNGLAEPVLDEWQLC